MLSCDTFALSASRYTGGRNILCKNSDRPLGEAQPLVFFPAADYPAGTELRCTHLTIPQIGHTYAVVGCKPYWIWGFEMGYNEHGLVIGNEAEFSRCDAETEEGLLGMDILRLALERAKTAREGVDVIADLLDKYGQNANANALFDRRYENSYMLVDPEEIWLMETAGRNWAARRVEDWAAISNCYSIRDQFDLCSPGLESLIRSKRWLHPDEPIDFAKAVTQPRAQQAAATQRWRRLRKLIGQHEGTLDDPAIKHVLRDHFVGELIEPRFGATHGTFVSICMHATAWDSSQTAASLLCGYDPVLGPVACYAPSLPCCSVYLPVYWTKELPHALSFGDGVYSGDSLWWRMQRLAMLISVDEARYGEATRQQLRTFEAALSVHASAAEERARTLILNGQREEALALLKQLTGNAVDELMMLAEQLSEDIADDIRQAGGLYGQRIELLTWYAGQTQMPLP